MTTISLLGLALLLILLLVVLALALELLYVLCYRRRFQRATSVEDSQLHVSSQLGARIFSKELILYLIFYNNNQSTEDPALAASVVPITVDRSKLPVAEVMEKENATVDPCEVLHMVGVNEERKRSVLSRNFEREVVAAAATPFETPCASPQYYTPAASPVRDAVEVDWRRAAPAGELA